MSFEPHADPNPTIQIFADFDGTITDRDSIVFLTEKFGAGPEFRRNVLRRFSKGEIDTFETIRTELATVKISWEEAAQALTDHVSIDSEFAPFVDWCRRHSYPISVVSSGVRDVLSLFLAELDVPFHAHPVEFSPDGWRYLKDESADKAQLLHYAEPKGNIVYIGDGISDLPAVPFADLLFAKSYLAQHCTERSIPFTPYQSFLEVREQLEKLL